MDLIKERFTCKCNISDISVEKFKHRLCNFNFDSFTISSDTNNACNNFIEIFSSLYDKCFPKKKIKSKSQNYNNPWISTAIVKSSIRKRKLYKKCLKHSTEKNEKLYQSYKSLFETVKCKSKRIYYSSKI